MAERPRTPGDRGAAALHAVVALLAGAALVLQTALVVSGSAVLAEEDPPGLATRLGRLVSYFTIQSNLLVAVSAVLLARDPRRDGAGFRVLRTAALAGIVVTGVVHFLLLRPLLDLDGADLVADRMLHLVVPAAAVVAWLVAGPRPRTTAAAAVRALAWPVAWLAWTLVVGAVTGWFPYPFLDPATDGAAAVVVTCLAITAFVAVVLGLLVVADRRLRPTGPALRPPATSARP